MPDALITKLERFTGLSRDKAALRHRATANVRTLGPREDLIREGGRNALSPAPLNAM